MKNKYDSAVIFLYAIGKEKLLPLEFRKQIPYSTISTWRRADYSGYLGHEFRYHFDEAFQSFELAQQNRQLKNLLYGLTRLWITLSHILLPLIKQANGDKELQFKILTVQNTRALLKKQQMLVASNIPCDTLRREVLVLNGLSNMQDSLCNVSISSLNQAVAINITAGSLAPNPIFFISANLQVFPLFLNENLRYTVGFNKVTFKHINRHYLLPA